LNPCQGFLYRTLFSRRYKISAEEIVTLVYSSWKAQPIQKEQTMRDNLRRYRARQEAFTPWDPRQPTGIVARHLPTLAALISGVVGRKSTPLPSVATQIPEGTKPESRVKRLTRWLDNARVLEEVSFVPSVDLFLPP
jgi:hypothetical protein